MSVLFTLKPQYKSTDSYTKPLHGLTKPPHTVEFMSKDAVYKPSKVTEGKEPSELPVQT